MNYKRLRLPAVILCTALLLTTLTACFRETLLYESDASEKPTNAPAVEEEASVDSQSEAAPSEEAPEADDSEIFLAGVGEVLENAAQHNDLFVSNRFNILLGLGPQGVTYTSTNTTLHMLNVDDAGDEETYTIEQVNNSETGNASMVIGTQSADGSSTECGLYFYENMMLLKKANAEKPLVLHSMDPQVASSYLGLSALERFNRLLYDTSAPKLMDDDWTAAVDTYLTQVADIAKDPDYSTMEESGFYAGSAMSCEAYTLKLMGERGLTVVRGLIELIGQDSTFKSMLNSVYMESEDEYGVTGLDGMLRDIDTLDDDAREAAIMTVKLVEAEAPVGIYVTLTAGDKTFRLNLAFYEDGYSRYSDITFEGFDGSSVVVQDENVATGTGTYYESYIYMISGTDGAAQEIMTADVESAVADDSYDAQTTLYYSRTAIGDLDALGLSGSINYSHMVSDEVIYGSAYGTLELLEAGETGVYNMDMSVIRENDDATVTPPDFLIDSGISTADQHSLYNALGDFDGASFILSTATTQLLSEWMFIQY